MFTAYDSAGTVLPGLLASEGQTNSLTRTDGDRRAPLRQPCLVGPSHKSWRPMNGRITCAQPTRRYCGGACPRDVDVVGVAWKMPLRPLIADDRQGELLLVVHALGDAGVVAGDQHGRQQQRHQHGDDGHHRQQFHKRKGGAAAQGQ